VFEASGQRAQSHVESGKGPRLVSIDVHVEQRGQQGRTRRVPLKCKGLKQGAEGDVLVVERRDPFLPHLGEHFGKALARGDGNLHGQQIHAVSHHLQVFLGQLSGEGHAEQHFLIAAQAVSEGGKGGEQNTGKRRALPRGKR